MSDSNRISTKFEISRTENEKCLEMKLENKKLKHLSPLLNISKSHLSYNQTSADLIKWPLLKSLEKYSHASQFTKHIPFMTLEGDTFLQIKTLWGAILSEFCQPLSTKNSWPPYKSLRSEHHNIYKFLLLPDTHLKFFTAKEKYEEFILLKITPYTHQKHKNGMSK